MKHTRILFLTALLGGLAVGLSSVRGATITVMNTNDNGPSSLRQALVDAVDGDTINFNSSLNGQTITLTSGELLVNKSVAISGPGANTLVVDANHTSRVFYIASGKDVTIAGLTITNGSAPPPYYFGGGIYNDHATLTLSSCTISGNTAPQSVGGGIYNDQATLTVSNCTISGNSTWYGGAISNNWYRGGTSTVTITNSTLSGNSASYGGAIINEDATLTLSNSTVSGNSAEYAGGAIDNDAGGTLTVTNSTLTGNSATNGGAISNDWGGTLTMTNSTVSGNSAGGHANIAYNGLGGGIYNTQTVTITNSTLSGNSAENHGGSLYNTSPGGDTAILKIGDTILNAGPSGENIYNDNYDPATVTSLGYNLSSDNGGGYLTATGDQINTDPKLGPLQDNGGPAFTHLPASDSPAIDAGDPSLGMDQRGPGFPRVIHGRIDVGAVEARATATPAANVQVTVQTNPAGLAFSVDGAPYTSTQTFSWVPGSSHAIATTSPQNGAPGVRYVWMNWSGGGAVSHTVAPATNKTYTANFRTQYQLTMSHGTGGRGNPSSGWRNSATVISISATPAAGYSFSNWTGSGNGSYSGTSNPASITMNGPITETATFTHN